MSYKTDLIEKGNQRLAAGVTSWVVISGKMASGKDHLAERLFLDAPTTVVNNGDVIRTALQSVIGNNGAIYAYIAIKELGYTLATAQLLSDAWSNVLMTDPMATPWTRSQAVREVLQKMGGEWMPHPRWLVRQSVKQSLMEIGQGNAVVLVGGRLPADVIIPQRMGALIVRLDVTEQTQLRRLAKRDGLTPTPELLASLRDPGEVALDNWDGFDSRFDNNDDWDDDSWIIRNIEAQAWTQRRHLKNSSQ